MSGEHIEPRFGEAVGEKEVAGLFSLGRVKFRTRAEATNFLESASEAKGVAGELHRAGIGQKLALTAHSAFDQFTEKNANAPNDEKADTEQWQRVASLFL